MKQMTSFLVLVPLLFIVGVSYGKDCDRAEKLIEKAISLRWDSVSMLKKEWLYKKAIGLCPSSIIAAKAHNNLGDVYEREKRLEKAIDEYKKAMELAPNEPYPYFGLGDIYFKTGRYKEAKIWYEKGLKYKPDDELTNKRLALIKDIKRDIRERGVIKERTINKMLARGTGGVVSITFAEGLIPFDFDSYRLREGAKAQLNEIGRALEGIFSTRDISVEGRELPVIEIAGHTDKRGTDEYNLLLSKKRAEAVVDYLTDNFNIPREGLIAKGYGEREPLCTEGASEERETPCNALNRRVEIIKRKGMMVAKRGKAEILIRDIEEPKIALEAGFFYQRHGKREFRILKEGTGLISEKDYYFIFFRPLQDCYVYILQEDSKGKVELLFPKENESASVMANRDYWIPRFGRLYKLDYTKGEERIYLLATSSPVDSLVEGLSREEQVKRAIEAYSPRTIAVKASPQYANSQNIDQLLSRVEGEGGWVRMVRFWHE